MTKTSYKVDLHTHSILSYDGGINASQYEKVLNTGIVDYIAITDHNETTFAQELQKKLGNRIIVGEEIKSSDGEIIGLFLQETISSGLSAKETIDAIHMQGGLVYIPHPMETIRKGLSNKLMESLKEYIDIIEVFNARGRWRGKMFEAERFAQTFRIAQAASSDAHVLAGIGSTYSIVSEMPTRDSLVSLLKEASLQTEYAPMWTYLYPGINKVKKKFINR